MANYAEASQTTDEKVEAKEARQPTSFWPRPLTTYERENLLSSANLEERRSLDYSAAKLHPTPERPRFPLEPKDFGLKGELFSETIIRERGPY